MSYDRSGAISCIDLDCRMHADETLSKRKERRFKTCDGKSLQCDTVVNEDDINHGTVIDISPSGLRLLCEGQFRVGQTISTELRTDRSHGTYRGVIRRVEPWVGGQSILGCQLNDTIPHEILEALAHEGVVNRRRDDRIVWKQPAKMSWELQPGDIDIEIQDCSPDGMKISSRKTIPDDVRVRIHVDIGDQEPMVIDARTAWQLEQQDGCLAGLSFTKREIPEALTRILAEADGTSVAEKKGKRLSLVRRTIWAATAIVVFGLTLLQTGLWE